MYSTLWLDELVGGHTAASANNAAKISCSLPSYFFFVFSLSFIDKIYDTQSVGSACTRLTATAVSVRNNITSRRNVTALHMKSIPTVWNIARCRRHIIFVGANHSTQADRATIAFFFFYRCRVTNGINCTPSLANRMWAAYVNVLRSGSRYARCLVDRHRRSMVLHGVCGAFAWSRRTAQRHILVDWP